MADLDSRLSKVAEERSVTQEKISVLKENAEKLNPGKVVDQQDAVRLVFPTNSTPNVLLQNYFYFLFI